MAIYFEDEYLLDFVETSENLLTHVLQPRKEDSHKGDNGIVCVVGGSRIFHGAPFSPRWQLSAQGAI